MVKTTLSKQFTTWATSIPTLRAYISLKFLSSFEVCLKFKRKSKGLTGLQSLMPSFVDF